MTLSSPLSGPRQRPIGSLRPVGFFSESARSASFMYTVGPPPAAVVKFATSHPTKANESVVVGKVVLDDGARAVGVQPSSSQALLGLCRLGPTEAIPRRTPLNVPPSPPLSCRRRQSIGLFTGR